MRKSCDGATPGPPTPPRPMDLRDVQARMRDTYGERDAARGVDATFRWLTEEVGELAKAMRSGDHAELGHECPAGLAWLASRAEQLGVDLESAMARFADGCPKCGASPCRCDR